MIKKPWIWAIWAIGMLSACNNEDNFTPDAPQPGSGAIELTVSAGDFVTDGAPDTRATDKDAATTFENGDRIGLIIVTANGSTLAANNLPYKFDGTNWAFDSSVASSENTGKTAVYYDNGIGNVTYIAYFPYSKEADGVATTDDLKLKFVPKPDQRTEAAYRASDLLVWTSGSAAAPQKSLSIALTHAYASVSLLAKVKYTLADGSTLSYVPSTVSDVSFTVGGDICFPFLADDGSFRCVLPVGTSGAVRWFYTFDGKTYGSSRELSSGASENTRYARQELIDGGTYGLDKAQVGDFYCKNASGEGYLVPGNILSLPEAYKASCLGIVLKAGKDDSGKWKDDCNYKLKGGTTEMSEVHGYVLALYDANNGSDCQWGSYGTPVNHADMNREQYTGFYGYKNTHAIKAFATNNSLTLESDFPAAHWASVDYETRDGDKYAAPDNSSGWFLPSAGQCWYWYNNRDFLLAQVRKATGNSGYNWKSYYWSSSEYGYSPSNRAWYLGFNRGGVGFDYKDFSHYVRSCLAF